MVIKSSNFVFLWDGDDGEAFKAWGDFAQLQWSVKDLYEDGGQPVSTGFQTDWCHTIWAWCLPSFVHSEDLAHIVFTYLQCRCGGGGSCRRCEWCFFKPAIILIQLVWQLLIMSPLFMNRFISKNNNDWITNSESGSGLQFVKLWLKQVKGKKKLM